MKFLYSKALVSCLVLIVLQFGNVVFAKPPAFTADVQKEFNRIKQSRELLNDAYHGVSSVPQEIVDYFRNLESSPEILREAIRDSSKDPDSYRFFLLEIAETKVVSYQQKTDNLIINDETRVKFALAFLAALRHPIQIGPGDFHSRVLQQFRMKILANLKPELQTSVKKSLAQYVNNPQARLVAIPAMILVADREGVIQYLNTIQTEDSHQMIELVLLALSKNKHLEVLRDQDVFQNFVVRQMQSESPNVRRLSQALLIQRNRGGLISSQFENNLLMLIADFNAASDARLVALRVLTSNHERKWFNVNEDLANEELILSLKRVYETEITPIEVKRAILQYFVGRKSGNEVALKFLIEIAMTESDADASKLAFDAIGANSKQHFEKRLYQESVISYLLYFIRSLASDQLTSKKIRRIETAANLVGKNSPRTFGGQLELYLAASQVKIARGRLEEKVNILGNKKSTDLNSAIESLDYSHLTLMSASKDRVSLLSSTSLNSELIVKLNEILGRALATITLDSLVYDDSEEIVRNLLENLSTKQIERLMQLEGLDQVKLLTYLLRFHKSSETLLVHMLKHPKFFDAPLSEVVFKDEEVLKSSILSLKLNNIRLTQDHVQVLVSILKKLPELSEKDRSFIQDFSMVIQRFKASPQRLGEFPIHSQDLATAMWELVGFEDTRFHGLKEIVLDLKDRLSQKRIGFPGSACAQTWQDYL